MLIKLGQSYRVSLLVVDINNNRVSNDTPVVIIKDLQTGKYLNGIAWSDSQVDIMLSYIDNGVYSYLFTPDKIGLFQLDSKSITYGISKSEVLEVYKEKYILTSYAKGLSSKTVAIKHVLRNSMITIVVITMMDIPWLISGSIIIENVFVIPGMGNYMVSAIAKQDFPVIQACVLIIAMLTVTCNLISDILTAVLDPRIKIEMMKEA
jgi:hypothetical protein